MIGRQNRVFFVIPTIPKSFWNDVCRLGAIHPKIRGAFLLNLVRGSIFGHILGLFHSLDNYKFVVKPPPPTTS